MVVDLDLAEVAARGRVPSITHDRAFSLPTPIAKDAP